MTVEEILAALQAIIDEATASEASGGPGLTDEAAARYEDLEKKLITAKRNREILHRNAAYNTITVPAVTHGVARKDDTLERAFEHYLRTGKENQDITELRAQLVGTDSAGGYLVPDLLRDKLIERQKAFGGVASVVEEITTSGGETLRWPTLDDTANAGVIAAENTAPGSGGADLVFGEKTLGAFKYVAPGASNLPLRVSVELLQDSAFDVVGLITRKLSERIARKQASDWVNGAGTTLPFGLTTGTAATAFTSAGITYAELVGAVHSIDPEYRQNAVWTFNDATLAMIEALVDSTGRPLLNSYADGISGAPLNRTLLGYPVVIDQAWPTYSDGTTTRWGAFGDLKAGYVIRRVASPVIIANPYTFMNEGAVTYTMTARADGTVQDANAFRVLINAV